jgi:hypothetical protein
MPRLLGVGLITEFRQSRLLGVRFIWSHRQRWLFGAFGVGQCLWVRRRRRGGFIGVRGPFD